MSDASGTVERGESSVGHWIYAGPSIAAVELTALGGLLETLRDQLTKVAAKAPRVAVG